MAQAESEPNNAVQTADPATAGTAATGSIGCNADTDDYFAVAMPTDGTIELALTYTNRSGLDNSSVTAYVYDFANRQIGREFTSNVPDGVTVTDTVRVYCRARDSVYLRLNSGRCFDYSMVMTVIAPDRAADPAGNDAVVAATPHTFGTLAEGRIGYQSAQGTDGDDYFITRLPDDGTVRVAVAYTNTGTNDGADVTALLYDSEGRQLGRSLTSNVPAGATVSDTLTVHCLASDDVVLRINSAFCFGYAFRVLQEPPSRAADPDGNDAVLTASAVAFGELQEGRIGYRTAAATDRDDYFKTRLPDEGTIKLAVTYTNTGSNDGADVTAYVYDSEGRQLGRTLTANVPAGITVTDTVPVYCRGQEEIVLRVNSAFCFGYAFRVLQESPAGADDPAGNDALLTATRMHHDSTVQGRIGYATSEGTDRDDYYVTMLPDDGTVRLAVTYTNTSNDANADALAYIYDAAGRLLANKVASNVPVGFTLTDTVTAYCRARDSVYLRIASNLCFTYTINYAVTPPPYAADPDGNDDYVSASTVTGTGALEGRIGHRKAAGTDSDDYFTMTMPEPGAVVRVPVEVMSTGDASLSRIGAYVYDADRRLLAQSLITGVPPGVVASDTLEFAVPDDGAVYLRMNSASCFGYRVQVGATDTTSTAVVDQQRLLGIESYPNPVADGYIYLHSHHEYPHSQVTLLDPLGRTRLQRRVDLLNGSEYLLPTGRLPAGIYLLQVRSQYGRVWTQQVVVK